MPTSLDEILSAFIGAEANDSDVLAVVLLWVNDEGQLMVRMTGNLPIENAKELLASASEGIDETNRIAIEDGHLPS